MSSLSSSPARPAQPAVVGRASAWWRQRPWARCVLIVLIVLAAAAAWGYAWAAKHVTVIIDGEELSCFSLRLTVAGVLADAGIQLEPQDQLSPPLDELIGDGETITIRRAFPVVIVADGSENEVITTAYTVCAVLAEAQVELGEHDRAEPSLETELEPGLEIKIVRVAIETEAERWRIASKVTRRQVDSLPLGVSKVVQPGKDGVEEATFTATYEDGIQVDRVLVAREVVAAPVNEIMHIGTAGQVVRDGATIAFRRSMSMVATAYYWGPECTGKWADGFTYTGLKAEKGVIAVDPRVIPLGTRVYVDGYGYAIAADIGGAIKGNKIDLCFDTYEEVRVWGLQRVTLYWLW